LKAHPDRCAQTLANVNAIREASGDGPFTPPGADSRDCRINLKLLQWRALRASEHSAAARARLVEFDPVQRPDLWAGTVQDGTSRGFAAALEEAISLAPAEPTPAPPDDPARSHCFEGKQLRRKKDLLIASGSARVRFSRKQGLLFVDRDADVNVANCLRFEAREDHGHLDRFEPDEGQRPRLFSAQFLQPRRYLTAPGYTELRLSGRLGRTAAGWDCELVLTGLDSEPCVRLDLWIDHRHHDCRLRARFLGIDPALIEHQCTDVREVVENAAGGFVAFTLVRSVGSLQFDSRTVPTPLAYCTGRIAHCFRLGGR